MIPLFGIISHGRENDQITLSYLRQLNIPKSSIFLCVWDTELHEYKKWSPYVNKIICTDLHTIVGNRNKLLNYTRHISKYIVLLDDDISYISYLKNGKLYPLHDPKIFLQMVTYGFLSCIKENTKLWGLYPVYNEYFMKDRISTRALIIGTFLGIINDGFLFNPEFYVKEDIDFTCRILKKYNKVIRFDNIVPKAKHYSKGGCEEFWKYNDECFHRVLEFHSDLLEANPRREGEVKLKRGSK